MPSHRWLSHQGSITAALFARFGIAPAVVIRHDRAGRAEIGERRALALRAGEGVHLRCVDLCIDGVVMVRARTAVALACLPATAGLKALGSRPLATLLFTPRRHPARCLDRPPAKSRHGGLARSALWDCPGVPRTGRRRMRLLVTEEFMPALGDIPPTPDHVRGVIDLKIVRARLSAPRNSDP